MKKSIFESLASLADSRFARRIFFALAGSLFAGYILVGKMWYRRHFSTSFCKIVVVSKHVKNTVAVLALFDQQKGSVTSNKNNWATYTANKEYDKLSSLKIFLSIFTKNGQSNLILVIVLVLESKGPYYRTSRYAIEVLFP